MTLDPNSNTLIINMAIQKSKKIAVYLENKAQIKAQSKN